jgi:hypothetical protein
MRRKADTGDIEFIFNVDDFAHADTLDRDKSISHDAVRDLQRNIQNQFGKVQDKVVDLIGDKLKKDNEFKKILDKYELVSKYGDKYTKVGNKIASEIIKVAFLTKENAKETALKSDEEINNLTQGIKQEADKSLEIIEKTSDIGLTKEMLTIQKELSLLLKDLSGKNNWRK